ncbi:TetR/AcrR family transcriptional regulator [Bacillus sp. H-16]|uniref:TetR/AcrR family transcriptional regulator n=1 Tax=Alteribacter salitolerans TaxID=2912333 RepID=UPI0019644C2D|nr:TetR/AcrR family transcriptional regulator [Alteribacter salitolerans]MBM7095343.1 TetR/AcrR family transcriptional regulator [Alteribacter salitolerans]
MKKGERTKQIIFDTATQLIAEKGFKGTTVSEVVKAAGYTQAAFYLHFKSKDDLLAEIVDTFEVRLAALTDASKTLRDPSGKLEEEMPRTYTAIFTFLGDHSNELKIVLASEQGIKVRKKITDILSANMKMHQANGAVRGDVDPNLLAEAITASIEQLTYQYLVTGEKTAEELGKQTAFLYLYGMIKNK